MTTEILRPVSGPKSLSLYPYQAEAIESLRVARQGRPPPDHFVRPDRIW